MMDFLDLVERRCCKERLIRYHDDDDGDDDDCCVVQFRRGVIALFCRKRWHAVIEMMGPTPPDTLSSEERFRTTVRSRSLASLRQVQKTTSTPSLNAV